MTKLALPLGCLFFRSDADVQDLMSVGTFCSGTDCAILVLQSFLKAASKTLNIEDIELNHVFSCESNVAKQTFLKDFYQMKTLHTDACEPISDPAGIVSAGFPCDDASQLHPRSSTYAHRLCVSEARLSTKNKGHQSNITYSYSNSSQS